MAYELTLDVVRASELARRLQIADAALRESEQRMALAAEAATSVLALRRRDGSDLDERAQYGPLRELRRRTSAIDFRRFLEAVHPEDRERLRADGRRGARGQGGEFEREYRVVRPNGELRWIAARGRVEADARGGGTGCAASRSTSRPASSPSSRSRRQRSELTHLSRVTMLGELSGSLAHELNQPLTAILSNAQAARALPGAGRGRPRRGPRDPGDIVEQDKRAGEVIRRLRLLLRKGEVDLQPCRSRRSSATPSSC